MLSDQELKAVSDALAHLQRLVGSSFDGLQYELNEIKKELNLLKYNVEKTSQDTWKNNQNLKQITNKVEKLETEHGN